MISRRTILWFVLFLVFVSGVVLRIDWEMATCRALMQQHVHQSSSAVASDESNTVSFSTADLCRPGDREPWWAMVFILGAFVAFIGTIIRFVMDVRIWFRRVRI
jgi:hypothetical protein